MNRTKISVEGLEEKEIPDECLDVLAELFNIGVGRAVSLLNQMLDRRIRLQIPEICILPRDELVRQAIQAPENKYALLIMNFSGRLTGTITLLLTPENAARLVTALTGKMTESQQIDLVRAAALTEVGNIILNSIMGTISNMFEMRFNYSVPQCETAGINTLFKKHRNLNEDHVLSIHIYFIVDELEIQGEIILIFESEGLEKLMESTKSLYKKTKNA